MSEKEIHIMESLAEELGLNNTEVLVKGLFTLKRIVDKKKAQQLQK